jgi:hypothetical protein
MRSLGMNYLEKTCPKCKNICKIEDFPIINKKTEVRYTYCSSCKKQEQREQYAKYRDERKQKASAYYDKNKENILLHRAEKKETINEYNRNWRKNNRLKIKEYNSIYKKENKALVKKYKQDNKAVIRVKQREYQKRKRKEDPRFYLSISIRKRFAEMLKYREWSKENTFAQYIGCSKEFLVKHIESQFKPGMTWENKGEFWHIDHIIPLASAQNEKQMYELCHYTNLQPLEARTNESKNNKMLKCWQKFKRDLHLEEDTLKYPLDLKCTDFTLEHEKFSPEHRQFIEKYEWLGTAGFGVKWVFTARWKGELAGVVMLSEPAENQFGEFEAYIQRGAASAWSPKNLNSKLVSFACKWMIKNTNKRIFTAYSDPEAGEIGTIYQACNFDYLGRKFGSKYSYILSNGRKVSRRHFINASMFRKYAKELGIQWNPQWVSSTGFLNYKEVSKELKIYALAQIKSVKKVESLLKHKYVLLLNYGKQKIKKSWESLPYPKREAVTSEKI